MKNRAFEVGKDKLEYLKLDILDIFDLETLRSRFLEFKILKNQVQVHQKHLTSRNLSVIINHKSLIILVFAYLFIFALAPSAHASTFSTAYLRLNNQQANSSLSGTACAQPSSPGAGTESYISVTFPSSFAVSQNTSDWNANTANIPTGSVSWPGVSAPINSVSGQTVTFKSSDLTAGVLYCFNFTGNNSTTGTAGDNQVGSLVSKNSSKNTIDSSNYAVSITGNDQIGVTASIQPSISDLPISFQTTTTGSQFSQNTVLSYTITYGSNTSYSIPLTIQAQWSDGTVNGSPSPSVDILGYVVGSASNAFSNTPAVVDSLNKTITWTIPSFPAGTLNKTVTFSLETNDNYTGANNVSFNVSARAISSSTVTPDQTVTQNYLYSVPSSATPAPTPTPNPAGIISGKSPFSISDISINSVSQDTAGISVTTTTPSTLKVIYGTSVNSLSQNISTLSLQQQTTVNLTDLAPNTDYYFRVIATGSSGNSLTSDIFTFTTAVISQKPSVQTNSLVVTSQSNVLVNPSINSSLNVTNKNIIVVPASSNFQIQFSLKKAASVKSIQAIIRSNVLGANTFVQEADASTDYVDLVEVQPGVYTGRLRSKPIPGEYEIFVRIIDFNGNITEEKIADLTVTSQFTVLDKKTGRPVEGARVLFYLYNQNTKIYETISPQVLSFANPQFTDINGILSLVLPYGKYKADISNISFDSSTVEFEITPNSTKYPTVYLQEEPSNPINFLQYLGNTFIDAMYSNQQYLLAHTASNRLLDLLTFIALFVFVASIFFSFSAKTHVPLSSIPYFFVAKTKLLLYKNKSSIIVGKILNSENKPVSKANVYIIDADKNKILAHLKTNKLGEFYFNNMQADNYKISVMKKGFSPTPFIEYSKQSLNQGINIKLKRDNEYQKPLYEIWTIYFEDMLGILFEFLLVSALIAQIFFIFTFGFLRIAPFLVISSANIILFFLFLYRPKNL